MTTLWQVSEGSTEGCLLKSTDSYLLPDSEATLPSWRKSVGRAGTNYRRAAAFCLGASFSLVVPLKVDFDLLSMMTFLKLSVHKTEHLLFCSLF